MLKEKDISAITQISMFAKLNAEKGNLDDYLAIEKAKSMRIEEMELV